MHQELKYFEKSGNQYKYKPKLNFTMGLVVFILGGIGLLVLFFGLEEDTTWVPPILLVAVGIILFVVYGRVFIIDLDRKGIVSGVKYGKEFFVPFNNIDQFVVHRTSNLFFSNRWLVLYYVTQNKKIRKRNLIENIPKKRIQGILNEINQLKPL